MVAFHPSPEYHFLLVTTEFLCLAVIIYLIVFGKTEKLHEEYVHHRIVSERLRMKRFFAELGLRIYKISLSPIHDPLDGRPNFLVLDNTRKLINLSAFSYLRFQTKKENFLSKLIVDQYNYHNRKKEKFEHRNGIYKQFRKYLFLTFVLSVTIHFFNSANEFLLHHGFHLTNFYPGIFHSELFEEILLFLTLYIPPTIAACEALKYLYEWEKIIANSTAMSAYFKKMEVELKKIETEEALESFINSINKDMLIENLEWEKYMEYKNEVPT
jgi:hypothetical protein